ncbi:hypothetical protein FACS1894156_8130 [Bacteroidia bacterium]|nr:hypothetical protein FACS1894156_8130 [Bacteroidia bacterium]
MKKFISLSWALAIVGLCVFFWACAAPKKAEEPAPEPVAAADPQPSNDEEEEEEIEEEVVRTPKPKKAKAVAANNAPRVSKQTLLYPLGGTLLSASSIQVLQKVVASVSKNPGATLFISGYADNSGNSAFNMKVSQQRAKEVAAYLQRKGVAKDKIIVRSYGSSNFVAPNDTEANAAKNRRVVVEISYKK